MTLADCRLRFPPRLLATGEYAAAERVVRDGVALCPDAAWDLHAVAHVFDMNGRARAGIEWLVGREPSTAHCHNFRFDVW